MKDQRTFSKDCLGLPEENAETWVAKKLTMSASEANSILGPALTPVTWIDEEISDQVVQAVTSDGIKLLSGRTVTWGSPVSRPVSGEGASGITCDGIGRHVAELEQRNASQVVIIQELRAKLDRQDRAIAGLTEELDQWRNAFGEALLSKAAGPAPVTYKVSVPVLYTEEL